MKTAKGARAKKKGTILRTRVTYAKVKIMAREPWVPPTPKENERISWWFFESADIVVRDVGDFGDAFLIVKNRFGSQILKRPINTSCLLAYIQDARQQASRPLVIVWD